MKQPILIFLVSLFALTLFPEVAQGQSREEMLRAIRTTGASIESLECEFTQTKTVSMLEQKMVSEGKLYFRKPSAVRWEYLTPVHNFFIMNGEDLLAGNDASAKHSSLKKSLKNTETQFETMWSNSRLLGNNNSRQTNLAHSSQK